MRGSHSQPKYPVRIARSNSPAKRCWKCGVERWHSADCPTLLTKSEGRYLLLGFKTATLTPDDHELIEALLNKFMIVGQNGKLTLTAKGKQWCLGNESLLGEVEGQGNLFAGC